MKRLSVSILALAITLTAAHARQTQSSPLGLAYGGYLDFYYQYDFGRPHAPLSGRFFDIKHDTWTLAEGDLDIGRPTSKKSPLGFTLQLIAGKSAEILHSTEPGGVYRYKFLGQAYVTYADQGKNPFTIDFGEFYTFIGYEGYDSRTQDDYSRSFDNTLAEPDYHFGLRVTKPFNEKWTGVFYLVNGWNEIQDANHGKSVGATLTFAPNDRTSFTLQDYLGLEGSNDPNPSGTFGGIGYPQAGVRSTDLIDAVATFQISPAFKLAFCGDYGTAASPNSGKWDGEALYLKKQLRPNLSATLRLDRMNDPQGLRLGAPALLHSVTATLDWNPTKYFFLRLEARSDFSNIALFPTHDGFSSRRTTITFAQILHF